jgi:hypothetical protein
MYILMFLILDHKLIYNSSKDIAYINQSIHPIQHHQGNLESLEQEQGQGQEQGQEQGQKLEQEQEQEQVYL